MPGALRMVRLRREDDLRPDRAFLRDGRRRCFETKETNEGKGRDNPAEPGKAYTEARSH